MHLGENAKSLGWLSSRATALWRWLNHSRSRPEITRADWASGAVLARGTAFGFILLFVSLFMAGDKPTNLAVFTFGSAFGWAVGTLLSPWGRAEKSEFSTYIRAIATFLSGYVLAKFQAIVDAIGIEKFVEPIVMRRLILFAASATLGAVIVFLGRRYAIEEDRESGERSQLSEAPSN